MKKLKDMLLVVVYIVSFGAAFGMSVYRAIPANGFPDFDRGSYVTMAPLFGLFFLMGLGALFGLILEWLEES